VDVEVFANRIHAALARRKIELSRIAISVRNADGDHGAWLGRAAVVLAYAHWEGFVKEASTKYIKYVNSQNLPIQQMQMSLQAACMISHFKRAEGTSKSGYLASLLAEMDAKRSEIFRISPDKIVDTESNLSSRVFRDLVSGLGLDYLSEFETRGQFIDEHLLHGRNQVAHGEPTVFTPEEALQRIEGVVLLIDGYSNQLIDAVRDANYLLPTG
jgi:hypothetical protein